VVAALQAARDMGRDDIMVVLIPDTGERYLSKVHSEAWLAQHGIQDVQG
jgi:cystathionine beta-synthase